jgi:pyridoxamine---pyruvate transaminase
MVSDPGTGPVFTLATGPAGATPATLAALSQPILHHLDPAFRARYAETVELLRQAFGTEQDPVILPGEAVVGLEAAAASLIGPDDVVLNLVSGMYGKGFGHVAARYAGAVIELAVDYASVIPARLVAQALGERPDITIVSVVHCETPSGTVNDLSAIAGATGSALLLVDAVSSFGAERCDVARWDLAVVAPQKSLGGPPGLSLLHVSDRAWQHIVANPKAPRQSALSILDWRDVHLDGHAFPFTPNVAEINALHECLRQYLIEGPAAVRERHERAARAARAGAQALAGAQASGDVEARGGVELWARDPRTRSNAVTAIKMPDGIDEARVRAIARAEFGVMLAGGQGEFAGRVLQIGHLGPAAYPLSPVIALTALGGALRRLGAHADIGAAVEAALAANP